jgi:hypothetical protein
LASLVRVRTSDGKHVGNLRHVVLEHASCKVSGIVVDIGPLRAGRAVFERRLGNYDVTGEPADIASASEQGIALKLTEAAFMQQPPYTVDHFERPPDLTPDGST